MDPASIVNDMHYNNVAKKIATQQKAHFTQISLRIWQIFGHITMAQGKRSTIRPMAILMHLSWALERGTISGVGTYLKEKKGKDGVKIILADERFGFVPSCKRRNCIRSTAAERKLERHRFDTITEGVGIDRLVGNFLIGEGH